MTMSPNRFDKILVVDDSTGSLQLLMDLLSKNGYTVYPASNGKLALEFVQSTLPDLILLDIKMPGIDGYEVCQRLKADERTVSIPIIFLSALEDEPDKVKGFQAGGVDYITKPFQPEELLARVGIHLRLRELTEGLEQEVSVRTEELTIANKRLEKEIAERRQAEEALRRTSRALRTISASSMTLVRAAEEEQFLADMCQAVVDQGGYRLAWIGYKEHDEARSVRQVTCACCGGGCPTVPRMSWALNADGQNPASLALRLGTPQIAKDILADPQHVSWRGYALECGFASSLALPLKGDGDEAFGVLNICAAEPGGFDGDEIRLLQDLASDVAFGVLSLRTRQQRDHLERANIRSLQRVKEALLGTVGAVGRMAERRDPYTGGHQSRVARLACAMAEELGLASDRIEGLRIGAMIHDIGKIAMPAEILNRPGRLTAPELEILKSHAQVGYEIIKDVSFPWPVAEMVLQHHERLDGSGYPRSLKGDEICPEARIIGIADAVDAVCAHRPYRAAKGLEKALAIIAAERGRGFDADAVDACLRLFREKGYSLTAGDESRGDGEEGQNV